MVKHEVVSQDKWLKARQELLAKEKEFTRLRDELSESRRRLPWAKVDKPYVFDGPAGKETLADLFAGRRQLIVYHFMFAPDWEAGCKSCSFWADNFNGITAHLNQRDVTLVAISRAPPATLQGFERRMGWSFKWLSSHGNDFNFDYGVEERSDGCADDEHRQQHHGDEIRGKWQHHECIKCGRFCSAFRTSARSQRVQQYAGGHCHVQRLDARRHADRHAP